MSGAAWERLDIAASTAPSRIIGGTTAGPSDARPTDITTGPDGNLWFTESNGNRIGQITPDRLDHRVRCPDIQQ